MGGTAHFANTIILSGGHYFDNSGYEGKAIVMVRQAIKMSHYVVDNANLLCRKTPRMTVGPTSPVRVGKFGIPETPSYLLGTHSIAEEQREVEADKIDKHMKRQQMKNN